MRTLVCLIPLLLSTPASAGDHGKPRRAVMYQLLKDVRVLLPRAVDGQTLSQPRGLAETRAAVDRLAKNAAALQKHTAADEPGQRWLGRELASDARELKQRFGLKQFDEAAFTVHEMTRTCIACHTRLKSDSSRLAEGMIEKSALNQLPLATRARLKLATRQFAPALADFEALLADPKAHPSTLLGPLNDYLVTSVRVVKDLGRPIKALEQLRARPDTWAQFGRRLELWTSALRGFQSAPPARTLTGARKVMDDANKLERYPADEDTLIHHVVASGILNDVIEDRKISRPERAEAYLLLTYAEERIGNNYWLSEAEAYLEECVRIVPKTELAGRCFAQLEELVILGFAGSRGVRIPPDVKKKLNELRPLTP